MGNLLQFAVAAAREMDHTTLAALLVALVSVYGLLTTFYRLFLHPIRHIPGPKLAAASYILEFYYDVIKGGKYVFEIERMHEKYGPIVRINPHQVHINDPDFYDEIYAPSSKKRDKDPTFVPKFGAPVSVIATVPHEHHRIRRSVLSSFFSKRSVVNLEPIMQEKIDLLAGRLVEAQQTSAVVKLEYAYAGLTADVISHYCYGVSEKYLEDHWPHNDLKDGLSGLGHFGHLFYFFPLLVSLTQKLPSSLVKSLDPAAYAFVKLQQKLLRAAKMTIQQQSKREGRATIFDALVDPSLPPKERTVDRLAQEAVIVLGAGTETTANTLTVASYHLLKNRDVLLKLREELKTLMPTPSSKASWSQLEQLPYLTAVVQESLRLALGSTMRSGRVARETIMYKDYAIPSGTPMISAHPFTLLNPSIFPEPRKFNPDRWIDAAEKGERLSRYAIAFSRGSRACLGMNMAYSELYLALALFARRFEFEIHETTDADLRWCADYMVPYGPDGPWSVKVKVKEVLQE
ncbi:uncharacterized protein PV07_00654 [Cladophialophora immunda]|uniref:Cytochrome P450 n=1 Tax=Cladophialophora immunda TaxID=569365 RepID=A0A0D2CVB6_9EURO|nr:uncharacterized protein PV07_00654 [Cladophialophora immunda]KIW33835.1 hypothetical protein PV07_00654 [Cladophialophora immunda]